MSIGKALILGFALAVVSFITGCSGVIPMDWKSVVVVDDKGNETPASKDQEKLRRYNCETSAECIGLVKTIFQSYAPNLENGVVICPNYRLECYFQGPPAEFEAMALSSKLSEAVPAVSKARDLLLGYFKTHGVGAIPAGTLDFHAAATPHTKTEVTEIGTIIVTYSDDRHPSLTGKTMFYAPMRNSVEDDSPLEMECVDNDLPDFMTPDDCVSLQAYQQQLEIFREAKQDDENEKLVQQQIEVDSNPGLQALQVIGALAQMQNQGSASGGSSGDNAGNSANSSSASSASRGDEQACTRAKRSIPENAKGVLYSKIKNVLISAGWEPVPRDLNEYLKDDPEETRFLNAGLAEFQGCFADQPVCSFDFVNQDGTKLRVATEYADGDDVPLDMPVSAIGIELQDCN